MVVDETRLQDAAAALLGHNGIDGVSVATVGFPNGTAPVTADGIGAVGPPGTPTPGPTVVDGEVLLQATLTNTADPNAAAATVL